MSASFTATLIFSLALAGMASGETQQTRHRAVLIDLSPSMKPFRAMELGTVKSLIEKWEPLQTVDFLAVDGNPLGRPPLGHMAAFPYDRNRSNPTRYRLEAAMLRKKYLATILPAVEQAITAEDEKNKRNPSLADTCLLDGLEAAARAFRRVPSEARELLLVTDGYEDCKGSIHLPRERLSPARIDAIIQELKKQTRLPQFVPPVTAYFVGTRQNGASSRGYEDMIEALWIRLLTRCGAQLRPDNFTPTLQGVNMHTWPDGMPLLALNDSGDRLSLKDMFNSTLITGEKGCGKTSGSAAHLHVALLRAQCGGLVVCPKPDDLKMFLKKQIIPAGRERDVILMQPTATWNQKPTHSINVLDAEQKLFGRGSPSISVSNITAMLMKVSDLVQRQSGPGVSNEAFWRNYAEKIIRAGLTALSIVATSFDLKLLLKFVNELPNTPLETEEQKLYSVAVMQEAKDVFGENPPYDFQIHHDFVMKEFPTTPPNARGSAVLTVQVMLHALLSHPLRPMLFESTTFDLDRVLNHGGILILDMNVHDYAQGAIAGMILKDLVSRATQARPELSSLEPQFVQPVYLLYDEYCEYCTESDERHARMGRSARLVPIFIIQSTTSLKAQFHDKDRAQALLDLAGCRWAHQNGSYDTNKWMADTISEVLVQRHTGQTGRNWSFGPQDQYGRNEGQSYSEQREHDCPPRVFTRLLRGGPEHNLRTEAIFWRSGENFRWNNRRWLPVVFPQDFKPGRDEVRLATEKEGENRVREFASKLFNSAAKAGRI